MSKKEPTHPRPRLVTIMGWLLLLQTGVLLFFSVYHFLILQFGPKLIGDWWSGTLSAGGRLQTLLLLLNSLFSTAATQREINILVESILLFLFAFLALLASFGFFSQRKSAWILAMFVQAATLTLVIILYFIKKPIHAYILMADCIIMIVYLQHADVYKTFQKANIFREGTSDYN